MYFRLALCGDTSYVNVSLLDSKSVLPQVFDAFFYYSLIM